MDKVKRTEITEEQALKRIADLEMQIEKIDFLLDDYETHQEAWCLRNEISNVTEALRCKLEPITVSRFIEPLTEPLDFILAMSATPPHWDGYKFIEVPSPFPIDIRQCYYHPLGRMSKDHRDINIPKLAKFLITLKGKTVVHCVSYDNARKIAEALRTLKIFPLLQINNNGSNDFEGIETVVRCDAVKAFKTSRKPDEILLSVNLGRGVDFWEPEIQNNIIAFMPFQNPTDLLVKAKNKLLRESWQNETTAIAVEQAHGRIHRGIFYYDNVVKARPDLSWLPMNPQGMIIKRTFITDSNFNNGKGRLAAWYIRNKRYFSNSFNEVLQHRR